MDGEGGGDCRREVATRHVPTQTGLHQDRCLAAAEKLLSRQVSACKRRDGGARKSGTAQSATISATGQQALCCRLHRNGDDERERALVACRQSAGEALHTRGRTCGALPPPPHQAAPQQRRKLCCRMARGPQPTTRQATTYSCLEPHRRGDCAPQLQPRGFGPHRRLHNETRLPRRP